jgi:putative oxidoreductase
VQRFFSPFPDGRLGAGLLLLRAIASITGICLVFARLSEPAAPAFDMIVGALSIASGMGVLVGLFTRANATVLAAAIGWFWFPLDAEVLRLGVPAALMTIAVSVAIALLGPGAFAIDARLFGPREIIISRSATPRT